MSSLNAFHNIVSFRVPIYISMYNFFLLKTVIKNIHLNYLLFLNFKFKKFLILSLFIFIIKVFIDKYY